MKTSKLMAYEIEKVNLKKYILGSVIIILMVCFFMIVAMDSVMHEVPPTKTTYSSIIKSINAFMMEAFIIWNAVLIAKMVVEEYTSKTILIAFTYPIKKDQILFSKILLITLFGVLSTLIGDIVCISFVTLVDQFSDMLEGSFAIENLFFSIENILLGCFTVTFYGLVPYMLGLYKKSISATILSGFITAFVVQIFVSQCPGILQVFLCLLPISCLLVLCAFKISKKYIKNIEAL